MMEEMHALIHGKVQGVGFRATTKFFADQLGLSGYARNLPNGDVEICAQGERGKLEALIGMLKEKFDKNIFRQSKSNINPSHITILGLKSSNFNHQERFFTTETKNHRGKKKKD
ncbi:MAG: acylphosphatase [Chlamydiales bacterium]